MEKQLHFKNINAYVYTITLLVYFIIATLPLFAHTGSVHGIIRDNNNISVLSKVSVSILPEEKSTITNEQGIFQFSNLPEGKYTISCYHIGYVINEIEVEIIEGKTIDVEILLERNSISLPDIIVSAYSGSANSLLFNQLDIRSRPVNNGQDLMRLLPGMALAQHSGGGKAEQMFFRGFDLDHGTDIAISVDGIPVNMVSHAHGQGYADCHFIIPEIIGSVSVEKGPYSLQGGNLATSGNVEMNTLHSLENSFVKLEAGQFNTYHLVSGINLIKSRDNSAFIAGDILMSDGFFESPQYFKKYNLFGKYRTDITQNQSLNLSISLFNSSWDASGQIPDRAVRGGIISRYGAIDNTEGGLTSRNDYRISHLIQLGNIFWKNQASYTQYGFQLYSNFTFFLRDTVNGDQIRQKENRSILNYISELENEVNLFNCKLQNKVGLRFRNDEVNNSELSYTKDRNTSLKNVALGNIKESNLGLYAQTQIQLTKKLSLTPVLRYDLFRFIYDDLIEPEYKLQVRNAALFTPKISIEYTISSRLNLFAKAGAGFHSNDIRSVLGNSKSEVLAKVSGIDLGFTAKPIDNFIMQLTLWDLKSDNELVYVGDEGVVEEAGITKRKGIELMLRYQPFEKLMIDFDASYTNAILIDAPNGHNRIPLAPEFTSSAGISFINKSGINACIRYRYLADRPANESNTTIAKGYLLVDAVTSYKYKSTEFSITIQNLLNTEWREAQFETTSRLKDEPTEITEIHYTTGTPFNLKAGIMVRF